MRILRVYAALPKSVEAQVIGKQVLRSGTSVGAHYREGYRARSSAEYISKLEVGLQELEETAYWLELLVEGGIVLPKRLEELMKEIHELGAILATCVRTAKKKPKPGGREREDGSPEPDGIQFPPSSVLRPPS